MPIINVNGVDYFFTYETISETSEGKRTYRYVCNSKEKIITIMPSGSIFIDRAADDPFDDVVMMEIVNYIRSH